MKNLLVKMKELLKKLFVFDSDSARKREKYRTPIYLFMGILSVLFLVINSLGSASGDYFIYPLSSPVNIFFFIAVGLLFLSLAYFKRRADRLSFYAHLKMDEQRWGSYTKAIYARLQNVLTNDFFIFLGLFVSSLVLGVVAELLFLPSALVDSWSLIWQVHAAILGLAFVVLSFSITVLNSTELREIDAAKRVVEKVRLRMLVIANIILNAFIGCLALSVSVSGLWVTFGLSSFVFLILSVWFLFDRLIKFSLLDKASLSRLALKDFKSSVRSYLEIELEKKIISTLFREVALESGLVCPLYVGDSEEYSSVDTGKRGMVTDIRLSSIKKLSRRLNHRLKIERGSSEGSYKCIFNRETQINKWVTDSRPVLGFVDERDFNTKTKKMLNRVFFIKEESQQDNHREQLKEDVEGLLGLVVKHAKLQPSRVSSVIESLGDMLDEVMEVMDNYGLRDYVNNSDSMSRLDWDSIHLLIGGFDDMLKATLVSGNEDITKKAVKFITDRAIAANDYKNFFLFREFVGMYQRLYFLTTRGVEVGVVQDEVIREMCRGIERLHNNIFGYSRNYNNPIEDFETTKKMAKELQKTVVGLIKSSMERVEESDATSFYGLLEDVSSLLNDYDNLAMLKNDKEFTKMRIDRGQEQAGDIERVKSLSEHIEIEETLQLLQNQWEFSLGSWLLELYRVGRVEGDEVIDIFKNFSQFSGSIKDLSNVFFQLNYSQKDELGLDNWEMSLKQTGVVHTIRLDWVNVFYVINALKSISGSYSEANEIEPLYSTERTSSDLQTTKNEIEVLVSSILEKDEWHSFLNMEKEEIEKAADFLIDAHRRGVEKKKEEERKFLSSAPISADKIKEYKNEFLERYRETPKIKDIIRNEGDYIPLGQNHEIESEDYIGSNLLVMPKDAFVDNWHVSHVGIAGNSADSLVRGENKAVINTLLSHTGLANEAGSSSSANVENEDLGLTSPVVHCDNLSSPGFIGEQIDNLKDDGYYPSAVILDNRKRLVELQADDDFSPLYSDSQPSLVGLYKDTEVHVFYDEKLEGKVLIADFNSAGTFYQLEFEDNPGEEVVFEVREIADDDIDSWYESRSDLILEDGMEIDRDEAEEKFSQKVLMQFKEKFVFSVDDPKAVRVCVIDERSQS